MTSHSNVTLTTDGAARGNPGPGGWAALLQHGAKERLLTGEEPTDTTNNAMELMAVIGGLEALKRPCNVTLRADSQYVLNGLQRLLDGGAPAQKNRILWERLAAASKPHAFVFEWVKGHSGDPRNELVNAEANAAAARAYATSESRQTVGDTSDWVVALASPAGKRPVQWAVRSPRGTRRGTRAVEGVSQPTALYEALVEALEAARALAGHTKIALTVLSNYELIVKQGRGEWKVKQPAQQTLAARVTALRQELGDVRFAFTSTDEVLGLIEESRA